VTESFKRSAGRKVLSRSSAKELGSVNHLLVDAQQRRVSAIVIGRGKKAQLVDWEQLSGFGPDAVMVVDEGALRAPADDREHAAAEGKLELVGKRALSEGGTPIWARRFSGRLASGFGAVGLCCRCARGDQIMMCAYASWSPARPVTLFTTTRCCLASACR
jgi:sporulation protein YlmC with PRC-barrel domain